MARPALERRRHRSSARPLALAYFALIVYASLYPFDGWRWPPGEGLPALARLPWTHWYGAFDVTSNLLGYLPLGALLLIAARRSGLGARAALALAAGVPVALSYSCEVLQQFVPGRVPAMEDLLMNSLGALAGTLLAQLGHALGLLDRWQAVRGRWFLRDSAGAIALIALWPVALLFPNPVPLGLGQVGERLRAWLASLLADVPWAETLHGLLAAPLLPAPPLRPLAHGLIVMLGLLAPCLLAQSVIAPGWRRAASALGALALGIGGMTLSTALNFGPAHALAWLTPAVPLGLALGLLLALAAVRLPSRLVAGLALVVLTGLVAGVAQAPADPYFADSLQAWEQGRFVRFHGLTQWIGWLWPYMAMSWLLARLAGPQAKGLP